MITFGESWPVNAKERTANSASYTTLKCSREEIGRTILCAFVSPSIPTASYTTDIVRPVLSDGIVLGAQRLSTSEAELSHDFQGIELNSFNKELLKAINETIFSLLGQAALYSLSDHLKQRYSISASEWSDHLDLLLRFLGSCLGSASEKTVGRAIAKRLYWKLGMEFTNNPSYTLIDYVEKAKLTLKTKTPPRRNSTSKYGYPF
jgi:hypothetical protein